MSDSQSINTSLVEVMISSKNKPVFIRSLSDLTFQIMLDAGWTSKPVSSKRPIAWSDSRHTPSRCLYVQCRFEETGSTCIMCIVCHQVLHHPSQYGPSFMGKHLLAHVHIIKLNKLTESEVSELNSSTVDETALARLNRQGSCGIMIVSSQKKLIFDS